MNDRETDGGGVKDHKIGVGKKRVIIRLRQGTSRLGDVSYALSIEGLVAWARDQEIGGADRGMRTMLDALLPAGASLEFLRGHLVAAARPCAVAEFGPVFVFLSLFSLCFGFCWSLHAARKVRLWRRRRQNR